MKKITQKDINDAVWKACDTFRGSIDPSVYKDYVLTMLFVKYLSDVHDDKYETHLKKYNGDIERAERAMRHERFVVPAQSHFNYLFDHRNELNIGELIDVALEDLVEANRDKLYSEDGAGIFQKINFNSSVLGDTKDKNTRLKNLLLDFNKDTLDLRPSHLEGTDIIGGAYMFLIENFASDAGKKAGEFFTPKEVSTLIAKLTKSKPGSRICDPTCGSASLLIKAGEEVGSDNFSLYGQEANGSTWALAVMNMFLHGFDNATIRWGDTIRNPKLKEGDALMRFASFECLREHYAPKPWPEWPEPWRNPDRASLQGFRQAHRDKYEFHEFVQWIADRQLHACKDAARRHGLPIGLYIDLAVGIDPHGAAAWSQQGAVLADVSVGAPPD